MQTMQTKHLNVMIYIRIKDEVFNDFINLTQVHNFTVNAQGILTLVTFHYLP